ncbi:hypothetical protein SDRG_10119 [Saprolegnia diclina VS20]|uniref:Uncharacterized protein n=1 Tax=Saprolegnia diclina (strain VS20) TaxID=1156394 RepID=T0RJ29_SAPDV|nr:hypothetical protein SDRG_10119 [Saprolegnia diclina VS20]EQC32373.1 hypothetical protein SDRG_10119 [Saprolegnia diclina VS20]|eukprot:XP_008614314.1 hypothetical protein SDRG_10119 [Saprolegnia diclina VS20]
MTQPRSGSWRCLAADLQADVATAKAELQQLLQLQHAARPPEESVPEPKLPRTNAAQIIEAPRDSLCLGRCPCLPRHEVTMERLQMIEDTNAIMAARCAQLDTTLAACASELRVSSEKMQRIESKYATERRRNALHVLAIQVLEDELRTLQTSSSLKASRLA